MKAVAAESEAVCAPVPASLCPRFLRRFGSFFGPAAVSRTRDGASSVDVRGAWPVFVLCVFTCFACEGFQPTILHSSCLHANIARPPSLCQIPGE